MDAIISALVSFFLLAPLEAGVTRALVGAGVPEAMAGKVSACAKAAAPIIIRRATGDPAWLVGSVYALSLGVEFSLKVGAENSLAGVLA